MTAQTGRTCTRPGPDRREPGGQPDARVRTRAHPVDLHRPGLCRRMPQGGRMAGRPTRSARLRRLRARHARPPDGRRPSRRPVARRAACPLLRPLRRAAGRSDRAVGQRSLRSQGQGRPERRQDHHRPRHCRRQGPVDDLCRGLPRLQGGAWRSALPRHHPVRGRGGIRFAVAEAVPRGQCRRAEGRFRPRLRHLDVGRRHARRSPPACAASSARRSRSRPPTATCIPAISAAPPPTRSMSWRMCWPTCTTRTAR
jgi:hypothetical protein